MIKISNCTQNITSLAVSYFSYSKDVVCVQSRKIQLASAAQKMSLVFQPENIDCFSCSKDVVRVQSRKFCIVVLTIRSFTFLASAKINSVFYAEL